MDIHSKSTRADLVGFDDEKSSSSTLSDHINKRMKERLDFHPLRSLAIYRCCTVSGFMKGRYKISASKASYLHVEPDTSTSEQSRSTNSPSPHRRCNA